MGVIAGFRWLEVFGTAVAAFGLLGDMVGGEDMERQDV